MIKLKKIALYNTVYVIGFLLYRYSSLSRLGLLQNLSQHLLSLLRVSSAAAVYFFLSVYAVVINLP